jgi:hypothetical protein
MNEMYTFATIMKKNGRGSEAPLMAARGRDLTIGRTVGLDYIGTFSMHSENRQAGTHAILAFSSIHRFLQGNHSNFSSV